MNRFKNQVVIVTGAGSGMGKAATIAFAEEGAKVVVNDLLPEIAVSTVKLLKKGNNAIAVSGNISLKADVERLINETLRLFGKIDVIVNNAGILRSTKVDEISEEEWELVMKINVTGVFLCSQAVLAAMKRQNYGRIINMSSSAGRSTSTLGGAHYTASKTAVLGFTRHLAREIASFNITANAICPGLIDTEMVRKNCSKERLNNYIKQFPIHRLGTSKEVAALIMFLASKEAGYITGATFDINGGDLMI